MNSQDEVLAHEVARRLAPRYGFELPQLVADVIEAEKAGARPLKGKNELNAFARNLKTVTDAVLRLWKSFTSSGLKVEMRKKQTIERLLADGVIKDEDDKIIAKEAIETIYIFKIEMSDGGNDS